MLSWQWPLDADLLLAAFKSVNCDLAVPNIFSALKESPLSVENTIVTCVLLDCVVFRRGGRWYQRVYIFLNIYFYLMRVSCACICV